MPDLPEGFVPLLEESVGKEAAGVVLDALGNPPSVSVRINPSKISACPFPDGTPVPWSPCGYILPSRPVFTLDPLFHAGCYYVQDSSAMMVGHVFRRVLEMYPAPGSPVILDLCAAPGGKTTDAAASARETFGDGFTLVANEVIRKRFNLLRQNVEFWGDPRVAVENRDPAGFGELPPFDVIIADVPCSGEGMFRKDEGAVRDWSVDTVRFCAARQRRILSDIWPSLKVGGVLVYSTCTFNNLENDGTVEWLLSQTVSEVVDIGDCSPAVATRYGHLMLPGLVPGEGQFVAAVRKTGGAVASGKRGTGFDFPCSAIPDTLPRLDVDLETALSYLRGNAIRPQGAPEGLFTVCYGGHPLGQAKNVGSRCNNLYPKERRIRMSI